MWSKRIILVAYPGSAGSPRARRRVEEVGWSCLFDASGSVVTTYTLSTQTLAIVGSNLTIPTGSCGGTPGTPVTLAGSFHVS